MSLLLLFKGGVSIDDAFTGTTTIIFSQTGAFGGGSAHAGTSPIIFSQTGALNASAKATGTTTIVFSQTGALNAGSLFASTAEIVFATTGAFLTTVSTSVPGHLIIGAHEYYPWHNKDGLTVYFNKGGHRRKRYFPTDIEQQDVLVRKKQTITATTIQELDWDVYNFFDVAVDTDTSLVFSNPRDNSDFIILLTKDANATVRTITWPNALIWPDGNIVTTLSSSSETKLIRISYFGGVYRATLY